MKKNVKFFSTMYDKQIRYITSTKSAIEQEKFVTTNLLLKERLLGNENINKQFNEKATNYRINNGQAIII